MEQILFRGAHLSKSFSEFFYNFIFCGILSLQARAPVIQHVFIVLNNLDTLPSHILPQCFLSDDTPWQPMVGQLASYIARHEIRREQSEVFLN